MAARLQPYGDAPSRPPRPAPKFAATRPFPLSQTGSKGFVFEETLRFDLLVEDCLLIELKSVQEVLPIHKAQLLSYMKLMDIPVGLLINFHQPKLIDGIHRMILPGASTEN